jgi:MFS family permease
VSRAGERWTRELDRQLRTHGRTRALLMVVGAIVFGAALGAFVLSLLAELSSGTLEWGEALGSGRRHIPAGIMVWIGGPFAALCLIYGAALAVRLARTWHDVPRESTRRPSR